MGKPSPPSRSGHDSAADPSPSIHTSALLQPFQHLLHQQPPSPVPPLSPDSYERVEPVAEDGGNGHVPPGAYSARGSSVSSDVAAGAPERRGSFVSSMLWSTGEREHASAPPLELDPEEEERLADEWGMSKALSNAASDFTAGGSNLASPALDGANVAGVGLARFPTATAMSEAGLLDQERKAEALAEAAADEDVELLETRSMPDLDRPRVVSFSEAVLDGLDQRLKERAAVRFVAGSGPPAQVDDNDEAESEGPRIKIIERTATQRRERLRTQSLGPAMGLAALPSFGDLTAVTEAGSSTSGGNGIASRDSLFLGPRARAQSSFGTASARPLSAYSAAPTRRGSIDALNAADGAASRLSIAIPSRPSTSAPRSSGSATSPTSPTSAAAPRPSTSLSFATGPLEPSTPGFVSRFDPNFIAAQRAELLKERPRFANTEGGKPPKVVLMPAPLAGRAPSPPRKARVEGPGSDVDEEEEEEPEPEEPEKDERPAGALYGRSLMDVMAERKAVQKSQTKAFVSGQDGRRSMFDWKETSPAAQDALAKLEGHGGQDDPEREDDVPLALVPAGGTHLQKHKAGRLPASKSTVSIFGPDLIYQRELARAKELDAEERVEREKVEAIEAAKREKERLKEERRKSRGVLKKGDRRKSGMSFAALETSREWEAREGGAFEGREQPRGLDDISNLRATHPLPRQSSSVQRPPLPQTHTLAPSLSIPAGLGALTSSASGGDWFRPPSPPVKLTNDSDDEDEDEMYRPRPISQLALRAGTATPSGVNTRAFESDSSSEEEDEEDETQVQQAPANTRRASLPLPGELSLDHAIDLDTSVFASPLSPAGHHLPLPGEASSVGHGGESASVADTDEQPLGVRYSRQSLTLQQLAPSSSEDEDEEPLGKRYSRQSLLLPLDLPAVEAGEERLNLDFGGEADGVAVEDDDSEDDKPLGARYSTIRPTTRDDDDVPLAIHRLSLAPTFAAPANRFQPSATLHAIDDDGKTVRSDDSDDRPLGLKAGGGVGAGFPPPGGFFPPPMQPGFAPGFPSVPALPYNQSGFFAPSMPLVQPAFPIMPQPPPLAVAQMQMHAAMQQQQAAAMGVGVGAETTAGPVSGIEQWRRGVL
ncbi:hypothetical protein JCM6882_002845 [Rhodosporidiobolus microsporus]